MTQNPQSSPSAPLNADAMSQYLLDNFDGVETLSAMGYHFFYFGPDRKLPFVTIAIEDNDYDRASQLDRPGVFRLNTGVSKDTYRALFGPPPAAPGDTGVVDTGHDFAALDQIMPHPVYAPQAWVCVLNPSDATFETVKPLLAEAYALAVSRQAKREARG